MGKLILVRHHESEWNKLGLWTGLRDRHLTEYGFKKSEEMGELLKKTLNGAKIDRAFASMQVRSIETLSSMLNVMGQYDVPTKHVQAFNERDYGDYTGKDKWEVQKLIGEDLWNKVRREWDCHVPNGETLKMVYERTVPYFIEKVLPLINEGKTVMIVAHGNSCRTLIKHIENISDDGIKDVEMPFGGILIYDLDKDGHMLSKDLKMVNSNVNA